MVCVVGVRCLSQEGPDHARYYGIKVGVLVLQEASVYMCLCVFMYVCVYVYVYAYSVCVCGCVYVCV
jgi:hypothetical protein